MFTRLHKDFFELIFRNLCIACEKRLIPQERFLCLECWIDLPATDYHQYSGNKVEQLFWGRIKIEQAASFFHFRKGSRYQKIIHSFKYRGNKALAIETGRRFGYSLKKASREWHADFIVPIPLHPSRQKKRGYNQSEMIALGLSEVLNVPVSTQNMVRINKTATQTRKNRYERWKNVEDVFSITDPEEFEGRHILLADDVVTTGSTLEACASLLLKIPGTKVSIATIAFVDD